MVISHNWDLRTIHENRHAVPAGYPWTVHMMLALKPMKNTLLWNIFHKQAAIKTNQSWYF